MSLVKQIDGCWYKQEFCSGQQQLVRWDPMSEVRSYNRSFLAVPYKDTRRVSREHLMNATFFSEKNRSFIRKARNSKLWNLV